MATSKTRTEIASGVTLIAGAADTTLSTVDLTTGIGAALNIRLSNGASGPTVAAQVQVEVSANSSDWYSMGRPFVGSTEDNDEIEWGGVEIAPAVMYLRLTAGGNTGQDVFLDADISEVSL
jgi:hypothetical protein